MIKIYELFAFGIAAAAFIYGALCLLRKGTPKYFQLYVLAQGCYMLEELWVIVNSLLGNGSQDGLITVRLIGFFGCLCFMLSANANEFDKVVDEGKNRRVKVLSHIAPAVLLISYALYVFSPDAARSASLKTVGFLSIAPALPAAYFSMKHLLLPADEMGFLKFTRGIDIVALAFYAANYIYPLMDLHFPGTVMSVYDMILSVMLFCIVILCRRGAVKWKTLI